MSNNNSEKQLVGRYEQMLKNNELHYFDVSEFESIANWYIGNGQLDMADQVVSTAFRQHPQSPELKLKKAQLLFDKGKFDETYKLLKELNEIEPDEYELQVLFGLVYVAKGKYKKAEKYFRNSLGSSNNENYDILHSASLAYEKAGALDYAIRFMEEAVMFPQASSYLLFDLAFNYEKSKKYELASEKYLAYLEQEPFSANGWYNYGVVNSKLKNTETAIRAYEYTLAIVPVHSSAWYNLGNMLTNSGKYEQALDAYYTFVKLEEPTTEILSYIGECHERLKNYEMAEEYYRKSLTVNNQFADSLFGLGITYAYKKEPKEAKKWLALALEQEPENPAYLFSMAQVMGGLGLFDDAMEMFNLSVKYDPLDVDAWLKYASFVNDNYSNQEVLLVLDRAVGQISDSKSLKFVAEGLYLQAQKIEEGLECELPAADELYAILRMFPELEVFVPKKEDEDE